MVCGNDLGWNPASIQRSGGGGEGDVVEQVRQDYNLLWFPKGKRRPLDTHRGAVTSPGGETMRRPASLGS